MNQSENLNVEQVSNFWQWNVSRESQKAPTVDNDF